HPVPAERRLAPRTDDLQRGPLVTTARLLSGVIDAPLPVPHRCTPPLWRCLPAETHSDRWCVFGPYHHRLRIIVAYPFLPATPARATHYQYYIQKRYHISLPLMYRRL